jgi:hypothetical protein
MGLTFIKATAIEQIIDPFLFICCGSKKKRTVKLFLETCTMFQTANVLISVLKLDQFFSGNIRCKVMYGY